MNRDEAINLLKALVKQSSIPPSMISIEETSKGKYQLKLKFESNNSQLIDFVTDKKLSFTENKENNTIQIFKP